MGASWREGRWGLRHKQRVGTVAGRGGACGLLWGVHHIRRAPRDTRRDSRAERASLLPLSVLGSGACLPAVQQAPRPCQGMLTAGPMHPAWSRRTLPRSWLAAGRPGPPALERPAGSSVGGHGAAGGVGLHAAHPRSSALPAASLDEGLGPGDRGDPS